MSYPIQVKELITVVACEWSANQKCFFDWTVSSVLSQYQPCIINDGFISLN